MATSRKKITRQGLGNPESAAGQGGKADPQASSSCDRSSVTVGDLAVTEYRATRDSQILHKCGAEKNIFCYICAKFESKSNRRRITEYLANLYAECFGKNVVYSEYAPNIICNSCRIMLPRWKEGKTVKYKTPTIWNRPHLGSDCYFCNTNTSGFQNKIKSKINYALVTSVIQPVELEVVVPLVDEQMEVDESSREIVEEQDEEEMEEEDDDNEDFIAAEENDEEEKGNDDGGLDKDEDEEKESNKSENENEEEGDEEEGEDEHEGVESDEEFSKTETSEDSCGGSQFLPYNATQKPKLFSQKGLSDLVRNLNLPKDGAEFLASELKNRNLLCRKTKISFYRNRDKPFRKYFSEDKDLKLVYSNDVKGLINQMKANIYKDEEWRLFIDSSKFSLKAVLLHNGNKYGSIPIAHSTQIKEEYDALKQVLEKINYSEHNWQLCGDLKITTILMGQQSGFTKYPCFLCLWDSRARDLHYKKKVWPKRMDFAVGSYNIKEYPLLDPSKVLLPPCILSLD